MRCDPDGHRQRVSVRAQPLFDRRRPPDACRLDGQRRVVGGHAGGLLLKPEGSSACRARASHGPTVGRSVASAWMQSSALSRKR